ncbi:bifunctional riboflavin kinase/FAD synthetase [Candidatus Pantoea carbekii]|uniref:Riboflavin biosynthesis protein n=1 Tax=Candidatus Pantoea carbekii TaxID=1235990 RepID=U3U9G9_9GAMM|nr:bifunctional riboflavin kinase/FAD synthetase [Candidatus Pantoea carbekii]AKC31956.1 bifunctional riboflavin kinase_FMN adenylyltransferase [Candidatus Pantoea carbekii]BAO00473.1 riboflavin biosynthesis protein [Candidatus Pantoea carbekii]
MKLIRGLCNLQEHHRGCVLTIGNFDGVHRGHQAIVSWLIKEGHKRNLPVIVMLFEPHPLELFSGDQAPARLTCLREKLQYLEQVGVDIVLCIRFNVHFAQRSASNFIFEILVKKLNVKLLAVGDDFRFGAGRQGDFLLLQKAGFEYGFDIAKTKTFCKDGNRISSTSVREALANDDLVLAQELLGHPFSISGKVVHGDSLGRQIGFPTANISLCRLVTPVKGVFAVEVRGIGQKSIPGVANIGLRPTVNGQSSQLEVHLLDTCTNLYNFHIQVVLKRKIRNEQRFSSLEDLKDQIVKDVVVAKKIFLKNSLI